MGGGTHWLRHDDRISEGYRQQSRRRPQLCEHTTRQGDCGRNPRESQELHGPQVEMDDPRLVQQAEIMEEDFIIQVRAIADEDLAMKKLQQADWPMLQRNNPIIRHVLHWAAIPSPGRTPLETI